MTATEERKLLHTVERHLFQDELRHRQTRQGRFDAAMWHFDHPIPGTDRRLDPSDRGAGAVRTLDEVASNVDKGASAPFWLRLWRSAAAKLPRKGRAVLNALMIDWRTADAAKLAGVSRPTVDHWKKKFKSHFAQCWRAYKRDFAK